jgi:hypothetical protein
MSQSDLSNVPPPPQALMTLRIIWLALILGQLAFMAVVILVILPNQHGDVHPQPLLVWVNVAMCASIVPVTFVIRTMIFRKGTVDGPNGGVRAPAYAIGNIIFWAGCEGVSMFALVVAIVNGSLWPTDVIVAVSLALQALTFPVAGRLYVPPSA